jgi:hypothetical protein
MLQSLCTTVSYFSLELSISVSCTLLLSLPLCPSVTGSGVALDAVMRGLSVALVERDDFSSGLLRSIDRLI